MSLVPPADANLASAPSPRTFPALTPASGPFWRSGADGVLRLLRHKQTRRWVHPFDALAESEANYSPEALSGRGAVYTFTANQHAYNPAVPPPYIIALVVLDEQDDLRIVTNIVNCAPEDVQIGMRVRVAFEKHGDIYAPVFEPDA